MHESLVIEIVQNKITKTIPGSGPRLGSRPSSRSIEPQIDPTWYENMTQILCIDLELCTDRPTDTQTDLITIFSFFPSGGCGQ